MAYLLSYFYFSIILTPLKPPIHSQLTDFRQPTSYGFTFRLKQLGFHSMIIILYL